MRICALDQSTTKTGYAIFTDSSLARWGILVSEPDISPEERLQNMSRQIEMVIEKTNVDLVVFEDISLHASVQVLIQLARLQGRILQMCAERGIDYIIYPPASWRKTLGFRQGNGIKRRELKEQAIAFVKKSYGIVLGDDVAEGICIGLSYLKNNRMLPDLDNLTFSGNQKKNCKGVE